MHRILWPAACFVVLTAFTVYVLLDTFVITRVYAVVEAADETATAVETVQAAAETAETDSTDSSNSSNSTDSTDSMDSAGAAESGKSGRHGSGRPG